MIYYVLASIFFLVILGSTFMESSEGGLIGLFLLGATTYWIRPDLFGWTPSIWSFAVLIGLYAVLGAAWSIFKWHRWLVSESDNIQKAYEQWKSVGIAKPLPFEDSVYSGTWQPSRNKGKILYWISWWPFSVFWFLAYDLLNGIWSWVYRKLEGVYSRISAAALSRVVK